MHLTQILQKFRRGKEKSEAQVPARNRINMLKRDRTKIDRF